MRLTQVPKPMALTPICHAKFSMFGRVKSGTINASQLFFQGSHLFYIFTLRIHACNKQKHYILPLAVQILTALLSKFVPYGDHNFRDKCGIKLKIIKKTDPMNTLRPRDSFCFLLVSSHFFYPKFKRPIPSQKYILKQQVRVPLSIPKHSRKSPAHVRNPCVISPEPLPKRPENPSRATAVVVGRVHRGLRRDQLLDHVAMAFVSRTLQRRHASAPRMRGGRRGSCGCRRETKRLV